MKSVVSACCLKVMAAWSSWQRYEPTRTTGIQDNEHTYGNLRIHKQKKRPHGGWKGGKTSTLGPKSRISGSNRWPSVYKTDALTIWANAACSCWLIITQVDTHGNYLCYYQSRMVRDSNPRRPCGRCSFQDCYLRPLGQPSSIVSKLRSKYQLIF